MSFSMKTIGEMQIRRTRYWLLELLGLAPPNDERALRRIRKQRDVTCAR